MVPEVLLLVAGMKFVDRPVFTVNFALCTLCAINYRLLPAFDGTPTGLPFPRVNLISGRCTGRYLIASYEAMNVLHLAVYRAKQYANFQYKLTVN